MSSPLYEKAAVNTVKRMKERGKPLSCLIFLKFPRFK
jgi:hypothetical protein